ncbi:MAG: hypothetical protein ACRC4U_15370 [Shewanella sp.]
MKMKFGAIVVDGRGKINGMVASKNRAGAYLRTKVTPVNPQTSRQGFVRSALTSLAQAWRGLTEAQRLSFNAAVQSFAKTDIFGDLKNPSGFNLYMRLNQNLSTISAAPIDQAPLPAEVLSVTLDNLTCDVSAETLELTLSGDVPSGSIAVLEATAPQSPGKSFVKSEYRWLLIFSGPASATLDFWTTYIARFGAPVAGQKVFIRVKFVNQTTGQASTPQSASVVAVA